MTDTPTGSTGGSDPAPGALSPSPSPHGAPHRAPQRTRHRHPGVRRALKGLALLTALAVVAGAAFFVYANYRIGLKGRRCAACQPAQAANGAADSTFNVLVLASDSRAGLSPAEAKLLDPGNIDLNSGERADSIALVHVEPALGKAVVISIPRDLRVPAPGGGYEKINAYFNKGPDSMVAEVSALTGLRISHYVAVNFASFGQITQQLGGVKVYFNRAINDPNSGLNQPKGCDLLTGAQALAFVRDRDTDSDFGRIARQRLYVTLMMNKVLSAGTLLNPLKVTGLINLGLSALDHDSGLTLGTMLSWLNEFRHFSTSDIDFRVLPSYSQYLDGGSYVIESTAQANALLAAVRDGTPLPSYGIQGVSPIEPYQVPVTVLNGTALSTLASQKAGALRAKGYPITSTGDAGSHTYAQTVVYYTPGNQTLAQYLQQQQYPDASLEALPPTITVVGNPAAVVVLGQDALAPTHTPSPSPSPSGSPNLPAGAPTTLATATFGAPC